MIHLFVPKEGSENLTSVQKHNLINDQKRRLFETFFTKQINFELGKALEPTARAKSNS